MAQSMKRRYLLKALGVGCIGLGIAPEILAKNIHGSLAYSNQDEDEDLKDYQYKIRHFNEPHN